jgi:SNF2 family DNA or RNA helicase
MEQLPLVPYKRIIVFSSFVTTLNVLQSIVNEKNPDILTFQYTGKQSRKDRDEIVSYFTNENETKSMILFASLGAGSCGLNLVPCSTVFLADVSMNPFDELQAINRVHRITQKNKVNVYKFCMKNLIEESILNTHFRKIEEAKSKGLLIV